MSIVRESGFEVTESIIDFVKLRARFVASIIGKYQITVRISIYEVQFRSNGIQERQTYISVPRSLNNFVSFKIITIRYSRKASDSGELRGKKFSLIKPLAYSHRISVAQGLSHFFQGGLR
jgi:hypothetical protein